MKNIVKSVFIQSFIYIILFYVLLMLPLIKVSSFPIEAFIIISIVVGIIYVVFLIKDIKFAIIVKHFENFDWDYVIKNVKVTNSLNQLKEVFYIYMLALSHFNKYEDKMFLLYINRLPERQKFIGFIISRNFYLFVLEVMSGGEMVDYLYKKHISINNVQPKSNRMAELILKKHKKTITEEEKTELLSLVKTSRIRNYVLDIEHNS